MRLAWVIVSVSLVGGPFAAAVPVGEGAERDLGSPQDVEPMGAADCRNGYCAFTLPTGHTEANLCVTPADTILAMGASLGSPTLLYRKARGDNTFRQVRLVISGVTPGINEGELACFPEFDSHPFGMIALVSNLVGGGLVGRDVNDARPPQPLQPYAFTPLLVHPGLHESRRPKMTIGASLPGSAQPYVFIKVTGDQTYVSSDGLVWRLVPPPIIQTNVNLPRFEGAVGWARFAQNAYNFAGHPNGWLLKVEQRLLYYSPDRVAWGFLEPGFKFEPQELVWDEGGNLYAIAPKYRGEDGVLREGLFYQVSKDGGLSFLPKVHTVHEGRLDTWGDDGPGTGSFGDGVIGGRAGELHVAFPANDVLFHAKITKADSADPLVAKRVAHDPPQQALRKDYVRIALDSDYRAIIGWGNGPAGPALGGDGSAFVVIEE